MPFVIYQLLHVTIKNTIDISNKTTVVKISDTKIELTIAVREN